MRSRLASILSASAAVVPVGLPLADGERGQEPAPGRADPVRVALLTHEAGRKLRTAERRARRERASAAESTAAPNIAIPPALHAIAACESGGNPRAIGGGGAYRGKFQFSIGAWRSVGGHGDPAAAPEAEQDRRAAMLYARAGSGPWPVCG